MFLANKEFVMTLLYTLNFVAFNPLENSNLIALLHRKLIEIIDGQIEIATNMGCCISVFKKME